MAYPDLGQLRGLDAIIQRICRCGGVPGLSLGVSYLGETVCMANFGHQDIKSKRPPNSETLYGIGSITGIFTANAIAILVARGKLAWASPVKSIIPELSTVDADTTELLTVQDLLSHTLGLETSDYWWLGSDATLLTGTYTKIQHFNALLPTGKFRQKHEYNNWGYALAGKVIERLSDMSYGQFIRTEILEPLGMKRTTTSFNYLSIGNFATPYAALDDGSVHPLPPPPVQDGTTMVAAQGIQSSVNDLLIFSNELVRAYQGQDSPLKCVPTQFRSHISIDLMPKNSYGLGVRRATFPCQIPGGCNGRFVSLPFIYSGEGDQLVIYHEGSQAGYTSYLTMLPELGITFVVLTNSVGLADPAGWINQLLLETLVNSPMRTNFVELAEQAARNHIDSFPKMVNHMQQYRAKDCRPFPLEQYVGTYLNASHGWTIEIRISDKPPPMLQIIFQELESQAWDLAYHDLNTFLWLPKRRDELAKRAMSTYSSIRAYKIMFIHDLDRGVVGLCWQHDPCLGIDKGHFRKLGLPEKTQDT